MLLRLLLVTLIFTPTLALSAADPRIAKGISEQTLLFLGDSLTEGYGIAKEKAYPALLEKRLRDKNHKVTAVNAGVSGSTSASGESRLKWQLKNKPHLLILALGANDGLRGLPTDAMYKNLDKTIQLARDNKVPVLLIGMKIPLNYGGDYRGKYEKVFSDLAKKHPVVFAPFMLEGVGGVTALNLPDGIHPNEKKKKKIAEYLLPFVE